MNDSKPTAGQVELARLSELLALRRIVRNLTTALPEKVLPGPTALELAEIEAALTLWLAPIPDKLLLEVRRKTKAAPYTGRAQTRPLHPRTQKAIAGLCNRVLAARGSIQPVAGSGRDVAGIEILAMKGLIENLLARATERDSIIDAYFDTALREREIPDDATDLETRILRDALRSQLLFWQDFLMRTGGLTRYGGIYKDVARIDDWNPSMGQPAEDL
nr:hypothetical protein [uncultured organism]